MPVVMQDAQNPGAPDGVAPQRDAATGDAAHGDVGEAARVTDGHGPSAVGLMRLSSRLSFPPGSEAMYRSILRLVELSAESEFVMVPCGRGRSARFIAEATGASGAGTDSDPEMVDVATRRARRAKISERLHFEEAPLDALPYQDEVFDLAIGEVELSAADDPAAAVRELVRVTRPGGTVMLVQLVWTRTLDDAREAELAQRLGIRPLMLAEWKQLLREAGVEDVAVQEWPDAASSHNQPSAMSGLMELLTLRGRVRLLPRAWKRWGWDGVRTVLTREHELRHVLEGERALDVHLIKGTRRIEPGREAMDEEHGE